MRALPRPSTSRSTSRVCWPSVGAATAGASGDFSSVIGRRTLAMLPAVGCGMWDTISSALVSGASIASATVRTAPAGTRAARSFGSQLSRVSVARAAFTAANNSSFRCSRPALSSNAGALAMSGRPMALNSRWKISVPVQTMKIGPSAAWNTPVGAVSGLLLPWRAAFHSGSLSTCSGE